MRKKNSFQTPNEFTPMSGIFLQPTENSTNEMAIV